jgi:hypothetical protein
MASVEDMCSELAGVVIACRSGCMIWTLKACEPEPIPQRERRNPVGRSVESPIANLAGFEPIADRSRKVRGVRREASPHA